MLRCLIATFLLFSFVSPGDAQQEKTENDHLHVMSFNIRYGVAADGDNHWDKRKHLVAQTIKNSDPDIVGTQETIRFQADYLGQQLPGYTYVGRSRQVDPTKGEECGIFFRTSRFDKLVEGHFWLSQSPDEPGSKSWDSSLPRMATWLKLWDRQAKTSLYVINTHFDHRGKTARAESANLIRQFVSQLPDAKHLVVTGDFNAAESSPPYKALFGPNEKEEASPLRDTFRIVNTVGNKNEGTGGGFQGNSNGARIDWIAVSKNFEIEKAWINRINFDGQFPSDHSPVHATLNYGEKQP